VTGKVVENATVRVDGQEVAYSRRNRAYTTAEMPAGSYSVTADVTGLEGQSRTVTLGERPVEARFILGRAGLPHYYRGKVKVPYDLPPMVAVALKPEVQQLPPELTDLARALNLDSTVAPPRARDQRVSIFRAPAGQAQLIQAFEQRATSAEMRDKFVARAGQVVRYDAEHLSFLTDECVVKFQPTINGQEEARRHKLDVLRSLPYSENTFLLRATPPMTSTELLEICNRWADNGQAVWAEPNLVSGVVLHGDTHRALQGHHDIIDTPGAWGIVTAAKNNNEISNVVIAVADGGFLDTHEDLVAMLSPDRYNFSANSTAFAHNSHGTRAAGIAAAEVDNTLGVSGIAGFPAFCRVILAQIPSLNTDQSDQRFADMFLWCAGEPNGLEVPALPAAGADVISNSWNMEALAFDGKTDEALKTLAAAGCIVVFATGNFPGGRDYTVEYPLATHPAVIAVGASTITTPVSSERRVSSSNFGWAIDLCAPAGDGTARVSTFSTSIITIGNINDYDWFGQTSAACPQVAGVVALMRAVHPGIRPDQVRNILHDTAIPIDDQNTDEVGEYIDEHSNWYGYGRLNAQAAVQKAQAMAPSLAPAPPANLRIVT
jgi:subtilisin family serine protease